MPVTGIKGKVEEKLSVYQATAQKEPRQTICLRGVTSRSVSCSQLTAPEAQATLRCTGIMANNNPAFPGTDRQATYAVSTDLIRPLFMECWVKAAQGAQQDPTEQLQLGSANCHIPKNMPPLPSLHLFNLLLLPALAGQRARCVGARGAERSWTAQSVHLVQAVMPKSQAGREAARNKSKQSSGCL